MKSTARAVFLGQGLTPRLRLIRVIIGSVLFSCAAAIVFLAKIPYGFETNDQLQYLLLPYRDIYSPFLTGDWFTWQTTHYHPSFAYLIRGLHFCFGEKHFAASVFAVQVFGFVALGFSCLRAAHAMKLHWISAAVAVLLVAFIRRLGIGESIVNHGLLLPSDLALPFLLLGFADWMEEKRIKAGLMLGLAGLLHANFAVIGPLVLAVPEIIILIQTRKPLLTVKLAVPFLILACPSLILAGVGFFAADAAPEAIRILFEYRSPHHYDPPLVNGPAVYWCLVLLCASMPVWMSRKNGFSSSANMILLALIGSQVVAALATAMGSAAIIRLFLWRLSIPLMLISAAAFGETIVTAFRTRKAFDIIFAVSAVMLVASFAANGTIQWTPQVSLKGFGILMPFAVSLAAAPWVQRINLRFSHSASIALAAIPLLVGIAVSVSNPLIEKNARIEWSAAAENAMKLNRPTRAQIRGDKPKLAIFSWIDKHTPKDARFLTPPGMDDFRLQARRAIFVDWKCCPMKGEEIAEWERRMNAVIGTKKLPARGFALYRTGNDRYFHRSLKSLLDLARKEGLTHILARPVDKVPSGLEKLVTKGQWSVYRVR
jgi:hypothetical protein